MDIGANIGMAARECFRMTEKYQVLSIEPNQTLAPHLKRLRQLHPKRFDYKICGISNTEGQATLHIPVIHGLRFVEEATLDEAFAKSGQNLEQLSNNSGYSDIHFETLKVPILPLDSLDLLPRVVKIDVQGLEFQVVQGMKQTLERSKPILIIENNLQHRGAVEEWLFGRGYDAFTWKSDLMKLVPQVPESIFSLNTVYVHPGDPDLKLLLGRPKAGNGVPAQT